MLSFIALRPFVAALCLFVSLPLAAEQQTTQTVGQQREGVLFWTQAQRESRFPRLYEMFPSDRAAHGPHVRTLPPGAPLTWAAPEGSNYLATYMDRHHLAGVMVLQGGHIRAQRYAQGFGPQQRWESFSVAKSVTSTLLGIALQQGYIRGMDDTLATYIPELRDSAYADVTVQQLLTMTSGVRWNEDYADPNSDVAQMYRGACVDGRAHVLSYLAKLPRQWPAGTHWNYNTAETDLLGILVQRATHR
jgi:CubicO group peptidase (beta-lactamase class C family)